MSQKFMRGLNVVVILFLLNIFWLLGTFLGLTVIGLVPSTAALLQVMQLPDLFKEEYSYKELLVKFVTAYWHGLKTYHGWVLILPLALLILIFDLSLVQQSSVMKALFQWPLVFLMIYLVLVSLNYFILDQRYGEENPRAKLKLAAAAPLLFPLQSLCSLLLFFALLIIGVTYSWFSFIALPIFFYTLSLMFITAYKKKGLVLAHEK